jgi:hypothetical protein
MTELKRLLEAQGLILVETGDQFEVQRMEEVRKPLLLGLGSRRVMNAVTLLSIPNPTDGLVATTTLRELRKTCGLAGIDFYDMSARIQSFIRQYPSLLQRLASI